MTACFKHSGLEQGIFCTLIFHNVVYSDNCGWWNS